MTEDCVEGVRAMRTDCRSSLKVMLGLSTVAIALNVPLVWHYLGPNLAAAYFCGSVGVLLFIFRMKSSAHFPVTGIAIVSFFIQLICLFYVSKLVHNGMDRDSALSRWIEAIVAGRFPYHELTRNGNPISVLPFIPLVGMPFYLFGNVGLLQIFSFVCLVAMLYHIYRNHTLSRSCSVFILSAAPLLFFEVIARSDLMTNMTIILFVPFVLETRHSRNLSLLGVLLGCATATRIAMLPVIFTIVLYLFKRLPFHSMLQLAACWLCMTGLLVLPFLVWNFSTFVSYAPLGVNLQKLGTDEPVRILWLLGTAIVVAYLGLNTRNVPELHAGIAVVLCLITIATWSTFWVDLTYLQLIFLPVLFAFPRNEATKSGLALKE